MKYLLLSTLTLLLFACASEAQQPQAKEKEDAVPAAVPGMETSKETGLLFFSKQAAVTAQKDTLNLCSAKFETTIPLFDQLLTDPDILDGQYNIHWLEDRLKGQE